MRKMKIFPCMAGIIAAFASICIVVFSSLSCYYAKAGYDSSVAAADNIAQKYQSSRKR